MIVYYYYRFQPVLMHTDFMDATRAIQLIGENTTFCTNDNFQKIKI